MRKSLWTHMYILLAILLLHHFRLLETLPLHVFLTISSWMQIDCHSPTKFVELFFMRLHWNHSLTSFKRLPVRRKTSALILHRRRNTISSRGKHFLSAQELTPPQGCVA